MPSDGALALKDREFVIYLSHVPSPIPPTVASAITAEGVWADASSLRGSCQTQESVSSTHFKSACPNSDQLSSKRELNADRTVSANHCLLAEGDQGNKSKEEWQEERQGEGELKEAGQAPRVSEQTVQ